MTRVAVIGAGPSGIAAAKNIAESGAADVVVFDRGREVGGNWVYSTEHSSVLETTHIISSKTLSEYADFPMPADYPDYPSHVHLKRYFQAYARAFDVERLLRFGTTVTRAELLPDQRWRLTTEPGGIEEFDRLIVANGHHWKPRWPEYPGEFTGRMMHSHDFKSARDLAGQRVLVIGGGNSACDVAVETGRVSRSTDISMRRGYWILPKFLFGLPADVVNERIAMLPFRWRTAMVERLLLLLQGRNAEYGLEEPDHRLGETHPLANSELLYAIRHGSVRPRRDIARYEGSRVVFVDGTSEEYDVIVACTGFWIAHPFFDPSLIDYSRGPVPLFLRMLHPRIATVAFVGLFQPFGCIWPLAELQSKILARQLRGEWTPPADLDQAIRDELDEPAVRQLDTPRHTITVDYTRFRQRLLRELPAGSVTLARRPATLPG